ncbi:MAG: RnfABCDGE type electron transport complex subunit D [Turicibacter sp.]|nr:RnfABCDGE type electron transport complex subunit D [Turicibacter sp.]
MEPAKYIITSTPHIRSNHSVSGIMGLVAIALLPTAVASVAFFGLKALLVILITVASSIAFEALYQRLTGQEITIRDCSAAVTGLLLAFNLPSTVPLWLPIVGSFVAIVIAKQLFGGLGQNFINPALAGRAFLMAAYLPHMAGGFVPAFTGFNNLNIDVDIMTVATPLMAETPPDFLTLFLGNHAGVLGETSAILILLGGLFLIFKKVITPHVPLTFIATTFFLAWLLGDGWGFEFALFHILSGGLMLGAFFMATDYSSSPITPIGKIIMGIGCALITVLIRLYGGYPEGVSYAILLMNCCVPLIDKFTKSRKFGHSSRFKDLSKQI